MRRLEGEINLNAEGGKKLQRAEGTEFYMGKWEAQKNRIGSGFMVE